MTQNAAVAASFSTIVIALDSHEYTVLLDFQSKTPDGDSADPSLCGRAFVEV